MKRFLERHSDRITGTLSGFDRVLFRGTLRSIAHVSGLEQFRSHKSLTRLTARTQINLQGCQDQLLSDHAQRPRNNGHCT